MQLAPIDTCEFGIKSFRDVVLSTMLEVILIRRTIRQMGIFRIWISSAWMQLRNGELELDPKQEFSRFSVEVVI